MPRVHIVPFASALGIAPFRAAMTISVIGFAGFGGRLLIGAISDRIGRTRTLGLCLILQAASFIGFTLSHGLALLYPSPPLFAFSYAAIPPLFPALLLDFFSRSPLAA